MQCENAWTIDGGEKSSQLSFYQQFTVIHALSQCAHLRPTCGCRLLTPEPAAALFCTVTTPDVDAIVRDDAWQAFGMVTNLLTGMS